MSWHEPSDPPDPGFRPVGHPGPPVPPVPHQPPNQPPYQPPYQPSNQPSYQPQFPMPPMPVPGMMPLRPAPPRGPMPPPLRLAVTLMRVGAILTAFQAVVLAALALDANGYGPFSYMVNGGIYLTIVGGPSPAAGEVFLLVAGLLVGGGWVWMAEICRRGRNWGRIVGTVFFGLGMLGMGNLARTGTRDFDVVSSVVIQGIGLGVILLLWTGSAPYFRRPPVTMAPPWGGGPYQGW